MNSQLARICLIVSITAALDANRRFSYYKQASAQGPIDPYDIEHVAFCSNSTKIVYLPYYTKIPGLAGPVVSDRADLSVTKRRIVRMMGRSLCPAYDVHNRMVVSPDCLTVVLQCHTSKYSVLIYKLISADSPTYSSIRNISLTSDWMSVLVKDSEFILARNGSLESWSWNGVDYDRVWSRQLDSASSWRLWGTIGRGDQFIAYSQESREVLLFRKNGLSYDFVSTSTSGGIPLDGLTRASGNGSVLVALENNNGNWILTEYQKTIKQTYELVQYFTVFAPSHRNGRDRISLELSDDGNLLLLSGLTDCKFHTYQRIGKLFVLTNEFSANCFTSGGAITTVDDFINFQAGIGGYLTLVKYRQCGAGQYSNGTGCDTCADPQCDLCLNRTWCVRCNDDHTITDGFCVLPATMTDQRTVIVAGLMVSMVVCLLSVNLCCQFGPPLAAVGPQTALGQEIEWQQDTSFQLKEHESTQEKS